ncbi:MAG: TonB family protein [Calditrichaceae bacterium]|nr:TonB family protein [Calditrichaceae bacterium]
MLVIVVLGSNNIFAADLRLHFNDTALQEVLSELSKSYSIHFIYQDKLIEGKTVTCYIGEQNSDAAVQKALSPVDLAFEKINENTYVLFSRAKTNHINISNPFTVKKTSILKPPKAISNIQIPYPKIAQDQGYEGVIDMKIFIDENGDVKTVKIQKASDSDILNWAAVEYTKKIKFKPAQIDSQSVAVWSKWKIIFDLVPTDTSYSEVTFKNVDDQ